MGSVGNTVNDNKEPWTALYNYARQFGPDNTPNEEELKEMERLRNIAVEWDKTHSEENKEDGMKMAAASLESAKKRLKTRRRKFR